MIWCKSMSATQCWSMDNGKSVLHSVFEYLEFKTLMQEDDVMLD